MLVGSFPKARVPVSIAFQFVRSVRSFAITRLSYGLEVRISTQVHSLRLPFSLFSFMRIIKNTMAHIQEILTSLGNKYEQVKHAAQFLTDRDIVMPSILRKPYDLLVEIEADITSGELARTQPNTKEYQLVLSILGNILFKIGHTFFTIETFDIAEGHLEKCKHLLEPWKLQPEGIIAYVSALNLLAIINMQPSQLDFKKSRQFLEQAEDLYWRFRMTGMASLTIDDLLAGTKNGKRDSDKGIDLLKKSYTQTLETHKDIFKSSDEENRQKQLDFRFKMVKYMLNLDDLKNAAKQALLMYWQWNHLHRLSEARYFLAAAQYMVDQFEKQMFRPDMNEKERADVRGQFQMLSSALIQCWAAFGLKILNPSSRLTVKNRMFD